MMWFVALIGVLCALAGYFVGHDGGSAKWMSMYTEELNKRIKAENVLAELMRTDAYRQMKLLERFEAETA